MLKINCQHDKLGSFMYALRVEVNGKKVLTSACVLRCLECNRTIVKDIERGSALCLSYLKEHKNEITYLNDFTCENFNVDLGIKEEEFSDFTHIDYENSLKLCVEYEKRISKPLTYEEKKLIQYGFINGLLLNRKSGQYEKES